MQAQAYEDVIDNRECLGLARRGVLRSEQVQRIAAFRAWIEEKALARQHAADDKEQQVTAGDIEWLGFDDFEGDDTDACRAGLAKPDPGGLERNAFGAGAARACPADLDQAPFTASMQGEFQKVAPGAPDSVEPPSLVEGLSPSSSSGTPSTGGYSLSSPPLPPLQVAPPGPELDAQVAELMARDSEAGVALAMAIFRCLPTHALAAECERVFGVAPGILGHDATDVERSPMLHTPSRDGKSGPARLSVAVSSGANVTAIVRKRRCYCCDNDESVAVGNGVAPCAALRLYDSLASDLEARDMIVASELADGFDEEATYRGARWFMYRTFVAHQFGYLGKGVRVRIPDCVVAAIRTRYPAPGCTCDVRDIMACKCGGGAASLYRGHRDN